MCHGLHMQVRGMALPLCGTGDRFGSSGLAVNAFCSLSLITGPVSSLIVVCLVSYLPWILTSMKEG